MTQHSWWLTASICGPCYSWVCLFNLTRRGLTFDSRLHDISWTFIKDRENCRRNCSKISTGCCPHFVDLPDFCILLKKPPRAKGRPPLIWLPSFYCQKLDKLLQHPGSGHHTKSNWIWSRKGRIWLEASSTLPIHLVPGILRKSVSIQFSHFFISALEPLIFVNLVLSCNIRSLSFCTHNATKNIVCLDKAR